MWKGEDETEISEAKGRRGVRMSLDAPRVVTFFFASWEPVWATRASAICPNEVISA